jgi:EmrB/QacA subfamily drug resistance transporter
MERKWWTLTGVCVATFMLLVDVTIVNVALPSIQRSLHAGLTDLQWVVDAYALTLAALLLTAGTLADRFGRRALFIGGVSVFTGASLLCGLAGSATLLNLARALQGIGGAAMFATSLALIAQEFEGRERGKAIAAWGSTVGAAVAIGPLLGGVLTEGLGWEWIFFVNVPVGGLAVAIAVTRMNEFRAPRAGKLDWAGLITFSSALFLLVFGLLRGNAEGWSSTVIVLSLAGAACLLAAFVAIERRNEEGMLDLGLFRTGAFIGVSMATFAIAAGMFSMFFYITLYLQDVLGYSPLQAGLRFLPLTLLVFIVPLVSRGTTERLPARITLGVGMGLVSLGLLLMHGMNAQSDWTELLAGFLVAGVGIGLANPAIGATALGVSPPKRSGMASGINNTFRLGGIATGTAALGAIFQARITSDLSDLLPSAPHELGASVASGGNQAASRLVPGIDPSKVTAAARDAFIAGLNEILLVGAATALVGAVAAFALIRARDFHGHRAAEPAQAAEAGL